MNSKHIFARLLANENITVIHGNTDVATFNTSTRVLTLPLWNDMEVYDLLLGHEVGHALFTCPFKWLDALNKNTNVSHTIFNLVEDVRIERLIQNKYPGLVSSFKRGYKYMLDKDLFRLGNQRHLSAGEFSFLDRLNMKAKLRDLVTVEFTEKEAELYDKSQKTEVFEDVVAVSIEVAAYVKEISALRKLVIEEKKAEVPATVDEDMPEVMPSHIDNSSSDVKGPSDEPKEDQDGKKEVMDENKQSNTGYIHHEQNEGSQSTVKPDPVDEYKSVTLDAFDINKKNFVQRDEKGNIMYVCRGILPEQVEDMLVPYDVLAKQRKVKPDSAKTIAFVNDTKSVVANMIKEFELRKAAYQFKKATISKTGTLDVDKLHAYRTSEDLFLRSMKLGEFKDHGMVMLVDYSGSMRMTLKNVIKQVLVLATFCKKVNIPFEIYGFTQVRWFNAQNSIQPNDTVNTQGIKVFELLSSSFDKKTYREAFDVLVAQSHYEGNHRYNYYRDDGIETLGDTPLNESLMLMHEILRKFRNKYNTQKVAFVSLTDGAGTYMRFNNDRFTTKKCMVKVANKHYEYDPYVFTKTLVNSMKEQGLCDTALSYVLMESAGYFNSFYQRYVNQQATSKNIDIEVARKKFRNDGVVSFDGVEGYNRVILIKQTNDFLGDEEEEMQIDSSSTKAKIAKEFKKHAESKKNGRIIASKFAEVVS